MPHWFDKVLLGEVPVDYKNHASKEEYFSIQTTKPSTCYVVTSVLRHITSRVCEGETTTASMSRTKT